MTQDQLKLEPVAHVHSNGDFCADRQITSKDWPVNLYTEAQVNELRAHLQQRPLPAREGTVAWMHEFTDPFSGERTQQPRKNKPSDFELQPGDVVFPLYASPSLPVREEPTLPVLNGLQVLERMGYDSEHLATAGTFLMVLGERGMWIIDNPLTASPSVQNMGEGETGKDGVQEVPRADD